MINNKDLMLLTYDVIQEMQNEKVDSDDFIHMATSRRIRDIASAKVLGKIVANPVEDSIPAIAFHTAQLENKDEEEMFKRVFITASSIARGIKEPLEVDMYVPWQKIAGLKKNAAMDFSSLKPSGRIGKYQMYVTKPTAEGQMPGGTNV